MNRTQRQMFLNMSMLEVLMASARQEIASSKRKSARIETLLSAVSKVEDALTDLQQLYSGIDATDKELHRIEMALVVMDAIASGCLSDTSALELTAGILRNYPDLKTYLSKGLNERLKTTAPTTWKATA